MTFSSLISGTIPHHNKYDKRPGKVTRVIQHHWADVTMSGEQSLASPGRKASVNYLIHNDGVIIGQVPEEFRPWTSGGPAADNPSITIECQNSTGDPEWAVSDAAFDSIVRLLADIAKRHDFGSLTTTNYRGHREFAATACPGPYLWPRLQSIRDAANALRGGTIPVGSHAGVPVPVPAPAPVDTRPRNRDGSLKIAEDGDRGPATISRWQEVMGTPIDGTISHPKSALIVADQKFLNFVVPPQNVRDLTGKLQLLEDGDEGPRTISVRQFWLYNRFARAVLHRPARSADFDGVNGPKTNKLHQHALNAATARSGRY